MNAEASREEVLKKVTERARQILLQSGNCAQTSFLVLKEQFHLDNSEVRRAVPLSGLSWPSGWFLGATTSMICPDTCAHYPPRGNSVASSKRSKEAPCAGLSWSLSLGKNTTWLTR